MGSFAAIATIGARLAVAVPAVAAGDCGVKNTRTHTEYASLQAAVDAAQAGDRIRVSGICLGSTVVDRNLVIRGAGDSASGDEAILDGDRAGRVLEIDSGATVHLKHLVIRRGRARGDFGGGILNHGHLTLTNVVVKTSRADSGGGIYTTGPLELNGKTSIEQNRATVDDGGGVYVENSSLTMNDSSSIHDNDASRGGGGLYSVSSDLMLNATSSVHDNRAATGGGGIYVDFSATLTLNDSSSVNHNLATENGGGVFDNSAVTMNDSSTVHDNTANSQGGGIYRGCGADLTGAVAGMNVVDNHPSNVAKESHCS